MSKRVTASGSRSGAKTATMVGLAVGAVGISILWASGVEFPMYPPPGIVILLVGTLFVGLARWPWAPAVGAFMGLFVTVGFLISPTGLSNLAGAAGTSAAIGQGIQVIGVLTALIAGVIATWANDRMPADAGDTARSRADAGDTARSGRV